MGTAGHMSIAKWRRLKRERDREEERRLRQAEQFEQYKKFNERFENCTYEELEPLLFAVEDALDALERGDEEELAEASEKFDREYEAFVEREQSNGSA
jgi:hypothetical protein